MQNPQNQNDNKEEILLSFKTKLIKLCKHHSKNQQIIKKMLYLSNLLKKECQEPEIEIFEKFLLEMIQTKKIYEGYLIGLVRYYDDFFKGFKNGRRFIKELFEYSEISDDGEDFCDRFIKVKEC